MPGGMRGGGPRGDVDTDSLYKELGVEKNATEREIKKAWRKLCKTHHPDRGGDPDKFKKIEAAYDVLSDQQKRSLYDQGGIEAVQQGGVGPTNIFDLFGGGRGGRMQRDTGPKKPAPIKHSMTLTLEDVFMGGEKKITVTITTAEDRDVCGRCSGRGSYLETVRRGPMVLQSQKTCPQCRGEGIRWVNKKQKKKEVELYINPGVKNGDKQVLHDEGHQYPGQPHGDVIVLFTVKKHRVFKRLQADLAMSKELTLMEALCGFNFLVKSVEDGTWLKIVNQPNQVVQPGDVIKVEGQGLPQKGARSVRGNLYIRFTVVLPKTGSLSEKTKKSLRELLSPKAVKYEMPGEDLNDIREISDGVRVKLVGLSNKPDLNGMEGTVFQANKQKDVHIVDLDNGQRVSVRKELVEMLKEPNQAMNDTREIQTGTNVRLVGLTNRPDLNGTDGVVLEANVRPGAHAVQLKTGQTVSVRQELLEITDKIQSSKKVEKPKKSDYIEECTGVVVDLDKEKHTAAGVGHSAHDDDSDEEGGPVSCQQM